MPDEEFEKRMDRLFGPPPFQTIAEIMEADVAGSLTDKDFDFYLWKLVVRVLRTPKDCMSAPAPPVIFRAAVLVEFEVCNGGFAQLTYNWPEWLELGAIAYESLGRPAVGAKIRMAAELAKNDEAITGWLKERQASIREIFNYFTTGSLADVDRELDFSEVKISAERIQLARAHRNAFITLDSWPRKRSLDRKSR
jgi:hypothetical protein